MMLPIASPALLAQTAAATHAAAASDGGARLLWTIGAYLLGAGVLAAAVGGAVWAGRRLRADLRRPAPSEEEAMAAAALGPSEVSARHVFRTLQEKKIATAAQLAAMSPRERQLLFDTVATKVTPLAGVPTVRSTAAGSGGGAQRPAAAAPAPRGVGSLHCPACGAALSIDADAPRAVSHCDGCGRRVAARRDGARLTVTADES
jgi:hypothetical protein